MVEDACPEPGDCCDTGAISRLRPSRTGWRRGEHRRRRGRSASRRERPPSTHSIGAGWLSSARRERPRTTRHRRGTECRSPSTTAFLADRLDPRRPPAGHTPGFHGHQAEVLRHRRARWQRQFASSSSLADRESTSGSSPGSLPRAAARSAPARAACRGSPPGFVVPPATTSRSAANRSAGISARSGANASTASPAFFTGS